MTLIETQDRITAIQKRIRELQDRIKYHSGELTDITGPNRHRWPAEDVKRLTEYHTEELNKGKAAMAQQEQKLATATAEHDAILGDTQLLFTDLLTWFQGTGLVAAKFALELLAISMKNGFWVPHASRRVRASLNISKASKKLLKTAKDKAAFEKALAPAEAIMDKWDATRPQPVFTELDVSRTITATLKTFEAVKVTPCPIKHEEISYEKDGKTYYRYISYPEWPVGTKHGLSKYKRSKLNSQCEACGHAIKNPFNWVPMVLWDAQNTPKSLLVGRDCAETLFGVKMTGELELKEPPGSP